MTRDEKNLICLYNPGDRNGLIANLTEMCKQLTLEETELLELTNSTLGKLRDMTDAEFERLDLYLDFGEE
ncbi:transposon-transfer assisting family protein [Pseudoflavonifractor sp. An85]|uniref:transposon-transfer assisting family protein n=1 Tax=Pseudoflavonifractor sp. An85 TaxID=1965661 RepID=UPI000B39BDD5|nr:transposon-transfer assisting family protein [Pseudoflavonifractor sp. An85]OUN25584.1 hypothetical protein B5G37_03505 [Pseudoflavonifractor sp. An85]